MDNIKPEDIVSKINIPPGSPTSDFNWLTELQKGSDTEALLVAKENNGIFAMRNRWSGVVLMLIVAIVMFDMLLVTFYGLGIWSFTNPTVVIVVITDNFLKIFGLGFLITKEIFKKIYR